jgi:hypothetical protein
MVDHGSRSFKKSLPAMRAEGHNLLVSERVREANFVSRDDRLKNLLDSDSEDSFFEPVASVC